MLQQTNPSQSFFIARSGGRQYLKKIKNIFSVTGLILAVAFFVSGSFSFGPFLSYLKAGEQTSGSLCEIEAGDFCSQTQGGWSQECSGDNVGCLRDDNWQSAIVGDLIVGKGFYLKFSGPQALKAFLPQGGGAASLSANWTDPTAKDFGSFAGQVVALKLNVLFSDKGIGLKEPLGGERLGDLLIAEGKFKNLSVADFLDLAETVLGGDQSGLNAYGASLSDLNYAATSINQNFDNCSVNNNFLKRGDCPSTFCRLELSKSASPEPLKPGDSLDYHLVLTNSGTANCTGGGVKLVEYYDLNTIFSSSTPPAITSNNIWNFGTMPPGDSHTIDISMTVASSTPCDSELINKARFWSNETGWGDHVYATTTVECRTESFCGDGVKNGTEECDDGNNDDNDACSNSCTTNECKLILSKSAAPDPVAPGDDLVYQLVLSNQGSANCTGGGVLLKDYFDQNTSYLGAIPLPVATTSDYLKWNFGTISPGDSKSIDLLMRVKLSAQCDSILTNKAKYWSNETGWGDYVYATSTVECPTIPSCGDGNLDPGEECDDGASNGQVCAPTYGNSCSYCSNTCKTTTLTGPYCGDGVKNGTEECDDGNSVDNDLCSNSCVINYCQPELLKTATPNQVAPGGGISYQLVLKNNGQAICDSGGVKLEETYASSTLFASSTPNPSVDDNLWDFGDLAPGEERTVNIDIAVASTTACQSVLENKARFWSSQTGWGDYVYATTTVECSVEPFCGDGRVDSGETCDDGASNGQVCAPTYGNSCSYCSNICESVILSGPYCGDGVKNGAEQCDDGNNTSGDGCSSGCITEGGGGGGCSGNCGGGGFVFYSPRLLLNKTANLINACPGETIEYSLEISNIGNAIGKNLTISDSLPAGFTYATTANSGFSLALGDIANQEVKKITYTAKIADSLAPGKYRNNSVAKIDNGSLPNNTASSSVEISILADCAGPVLTIEKDNDKLFVNPGDQVGYTIIVRNLGKSAALNVVLNDLLPPGFIPIDTTTSWSLGDIAPGEARTIKYQAAVGEEVKVGGYKNIAKAQAANYGEVSDDSKVDVREVEVLGAGFEELPDTGSGYTMIIYFTASLLLLASGLYLFKRDKKDGAYF